MTHIRPRIPLAGVFGGGGLFGIGYGLGIVDGLRKQGVELRGCPMLGTSAGSWVAAATALEVSFSDLVRLAVPRFPNPRSGVLANSAAVVFGQRHDATVHVVACSLPRLRRTELSGAVYPLSTLVAASSAVPGLLAPQRLGRHLYIDGGVRSGVSVDLATPAELLVVIAPLAGAMFGPFGGLVERKMDREMEMWRDAGGRRTLVFSPNQTTSDIAKWPQDLFDKDKAVEAYYRGLSEASRTPIPT